MYAQISGDTSGTYVQPQLILPPSYARQPQSPTHVASPIKTYGNIDTVGAVKLQYSTNPRANIANQSISSSFEHQKHPSYLAKLVRFTESASRFDELLTSFHFHTAKSRAASTIPWNHECVNESELHRRPKWVWLRLHDTFYAPIGVKVGFIEYGSNRPPGIPNPFDGHQPGHAINQ